MHNSLKKMALAALVRLINEESCSNHRLLDGVGNIINNVYSLKHVKHDKDEFIRYNCSQQIDNVNNTHLLGCCLF